MGKGYRKWLLLQTGGLHRFHVEVADVGHGVRDLARLECPAEIHHRLLQGASRFPAQLPFDLGGRDMVRTQIGRRLSLQLDGPRSGHFPAHGLMHNLGQIGDSMVLITGVIDATGQYAPRQLQQLDVQIGDVFDVDVGALLDAAEDENLPVCSRRGWSKC